MFQLMYLHSLRNSCWGLCSFYHQQCLSTITDSSKPVWCCKAIMVMRRIDALDCLHGFLIYQLRYLLYASWALGVSWNSFCFNECIYDLCFVFVEHSIGSNTNSARTPALAVRNRHIITKLFQWWEGWAHWIVFMTSLCMYCALCFAHTVYHEPMSVLSNGFSVVQPSFTKQQ